MKKVLLTLMLLLTFSLWGISQVANYVFAQSNGTYVDLESEGTQLAIATSNSGATSLDDVIWSLPS
ncbi:MAG TPA: hypothetical protein PK939_11590, partial [Bacteroidales bacterium]|nr:hypothetical protein [Bacteroidales bacterium]